jgi:hypothetical protein
MVVISPGAERTLWQSFVTFSLPGFAGLTSQCGLLAQWTHTSCFDRPNGTNGGCELSVCWWMSTDRRGGNIIRQQPRTFWRARQTVRQWARSTNQNDQQVLRLMSDTSPFSKVGFTIYYKCDIK